MYLQTARYIYLLLSEGVDRTRVQRSKGTPTTGHTTTSHLAPTGFKELVHAENLLNHSGLSFSNAAARRSSSNSLTAQARTHLSNDPAKRTNIGTTLDGHLRNVHFQEEFENGRISFDYKVREGVVTMSNGLALMRLIALEV